MNRHQRMGSIFWLIIGIYVAIASYRLGLGRLHKPGPGFIFFLTSLILMILSIADLIVNFIKKPEIDKEKKEESIWRSLRWDKVLLVLGGLVVYVIFFNIIGFYLSTFLVMIFLFKAVEPTRWWIALASSLITLLFTYAIFDVWLQVPFPQGILGF